MDIRLSTNLKVRISLALLNLAIWCFLSEHCHAAEKEKIYVKEWALRVEGGEMIARDIAEDHGFQFVRKIGNLKDLYHFKREGGRRSARSADMTDILLNDYRVSWVEQQRINEHHKRDHLSPVPEDALRPDATGDDDRPLEFNDPLFGDQWYLFSKGLNGATRGIDMNTMPAWKLGITGFGVVVSIIDDGVDSTHPDLAPNFDMNASHDFQNDTDNDDPDPHPDDSKKAGSTNGHGTKCAGEVAAAANNSVCGVGVAYNAHIGGMRVLDGSVTDAMEAAALTYNNQYIDIYSCCWGPPDDGKSFLGPHKLTSEALKVGVKEGRGGKGSIFVWASGNGGVQDDCSADAYVGDIRTISIGAINDKGLSAYFMESCPSTMAVVVSGGPNSMDQTIEHGTLNLVVTTDLHHQCTKRFVGTSSSAPLASGIMALILQANPELTWRDVQHVITQGAMIPNVQQDGWHINGAGFHVNHMFGFGVLDAGKMVELALTWKLVPEQLSCQMPMRKYKMKVPMGESRNATMIINKCSDIVKMEHTIAHISFESPRRGDVSITLYSPSGTPSQLLSTRPNDHTDDGLKNWPFMTVRNWGENPTGEWVLEVTNNMPSEEVLQNFLGEVTPEEESDEGVVNVVPRLNKAVVLTEWGFTIYGTGKAKDDNDEADNPAINPEQAGLADQEVVVDIWNDEQADDEEINVDPDDISPDADLPPNFMHNFDDGVINTGAFDGTLTSKKVQNLRNKDKKMILLSLLLLETHSLEAKVQAEDLLEDYKRVKDVLSEYKKIANLGLGTQEQYQDQDDLTNWYTEETEIDLQNMKREELLLLLRELEQDLRK